MGELGLVCCKLVISLVLRDIILVAVVGEHTVGREILGYHRDGVLDVSYPLRRYAVAVLVVVCRCDFVFDSGVDGG